MKDIKKAAAKGDSEICITYKNYKMDKNIADMVSYWARICGFVTATYSDYMYIKW